jgi:hypothetical protein
MAGKDFEVGDRVRFKARGLPSQTIHTPSGEHNWQDYLGGQVGAVVSLEGGLVGVRGTHGEHNEPFLTESE